MWCQTEGTTSKIVCNALNAILQEEKQKAYRKEKRKERKRKADDSTGLNINVDPDMAAVMGFSGFGTTKPPT